MQTEDSQQPPRLIKRIMIGSRSRSSIATSAWHYLGHMQNTTSRQPPSQPQNKKYIGRLHWSEVRGGPTKWAGITGH